MQNNQHRNACVLLMTEREIRVWFEGSVFELREREREIANAVCICSSAFFFND